MTSPTTTPSPSPLPATMTLEDVKTELEGQHRTLTRIGIINNLAELVAAVAAAQLHIAEQGETIRVLRKECEASSDNVSAVHADAERWLMKWKDCQAALTQSQARCRELEGKVAKKTQECEANAFFWKECQDERDRIRKDFRSEVEIVNRVWKALGISTYEEAKGKAVWELVEELKKS